MSAVPVFTFDLASILIYLHGSGNKTQIIKLIEYDANIIMNTDYSTMRTMGMSGRLIAFCKSVAREYQRSTHRDSVPLSNFPSSSPPGTYDLLDSWDISSPNVAAYHFNTGTDCNVKHIPQYTGTSYNTIYAELPCTSSATLPTDTPLTKSTTLSKNQTENGIKGQDERLGTDMGKFKPDTEQNFMLSDETRRAVEDMVNLTGGFMESISVYQSSVGDSEKERIVKLAKLEREAKMMQKKLKIFLYKFKQLREFQEDLGNVVPRKMDAFMVCTNYLSRRMDLLIQKMQLCTRPEHH